MASKPTAWRHGSYKLLLAATILSVVVIGLYLGSIYTPLSDAQHILISDVLSPVLNLMATAALFFAARSSRRRSRRLGQAWTVIAVAQLSYAIADIIYSVLEIGLNQAPFPSIADAFYLAFYPLLYIGVRLLISTKANWSDDLKMFLDIGIVMVASLLGFLNFLLGPLVIAGAESTPLELALTLAYPIGDLILIWGLTMLLFHTSTKQHQGPLWMLAGSMGVMIVTDILYSYQSLLGTYQEGGLVDLGWLVGNALVVMAGIWQWVEASKPEANPVSSPKSLLSRIGQNIIAYIPYGWAIAAFVMLVKGYTTPLLLDFSWMAVGVGGIIGMVILRQVIALAENRRLSRRLTILVDQMQDQATALEQANQELQVEIAERKRAEEQLSFDALHDALTLLPNRALFLDRLGWAIEYTHRRTDCPFTVLFLDLDSFKVINDSLGHSTGDELLKVIAGRLKSCLRTSDTVARLGGDEFVILLEDTYNPEAVTLVARRILADLARPFNIHGNQVVMSASIGVVLDIAEYHKPEDVLRDADTAMYHAKALGKSRFEIFDSQLRAQAISRLEMENDLRRGLAAGSEFVLYYQPILLMQPNRIAGFEALIRWKHPQRGFLPPSEFIAIAEETGLILPLGRWVLFEACQQIRAWQQEYPLEPPLTVSVNISSKQFNQPDFVEQIEQVLRQTGIEGTSLKLELTESICLENTATAINVFNRLNALGVHAQIDDFGTGYSSLGYLQHYPVHTIKIDRTFVQEIGANNGSPDLVRTIVALARDLGMDAIAEGIETEEQFKELCDLGCPYGQGFLFSRPLDRTAIQQLLQKEMLPFNGP